MCSHLNKKMNKNAFNIVISGIGGQGIITLARILAYAAIIEKMDVKTSELHGLSQRGGSVETHIRFGKIIYSPLVRRGGADLIISLDAQESINVCSYAGEKDKTKFRYIFGSYKTNWCRTSTYNFH